MADQLGKATLVVTVDAEQFKAAMEEVGKKADETGAHVRGISELLHAEAFVEFGKVAFEAISKVAEGIVQMGERGTQIQEVSQGFAGLSLGLHTTADVMLGALREGTQGTIADFDLMKMGAKILGTGVVQTGDQMKVMAEGAKMLSERTGTDLKEAFDTLSGAMVTGRTNGLKHLGLMVDSKAATMAFAEAHGKTVKTLTDAEKAQAVSAATLALLKTQLGEGGEGSLKFGEMVEVAKAQFQNFTDAISLGISRSPVLLAGMRAAGAAISQAFGPQQKGIIETIIVVVEQLAIGVGRLAEYAVTGAQIISRVWMGLKIAFNELGVVVTTVLAGIVDGFAKVAEVGSKLPGASALKGLSDGAKAAAQDLHALSTGFEKNAADAIVSSDQQVAGLDKVKAVIGTVTNAMLAAQNTARTTGLETVKAIAGIGAGAEVAAARTAAASQKIADEIMKLNQAIVLGTKEGMDKRLQEIENEKESELQKVRELKGLTAAEYAQMAALVTQKYNQMAVAAKAGTDKIKDTQRKLQEDILLGVKYGVDRRLAELQSAETEEIAGLEYLRANYNTQYTQMVALVQAKYKQMTLAAQGSFSSTAQAADAAGFKTRAALQQTAAQAMNLYNAMKVSGQFTAAEIQKAWEDAEKKKQEATAKGAAYQKVTFDQIANWASQMLTSIFGKSKTAAIAGATIDLAAAIVKTMRSIPWPASLPFIAMETAAGLAQIAKIKSTSFATGTPNLDFASFAAQGTPSLLHGNEAVIPQGGGHKLAGEISDSMKNKGIGADDRAMKHLARQTISLERIERLLRRQALATA